jgi:hypothetical protein
MERCMPHFEICSEWKWGHRYETGNHGEIQPKRSRNSEVHSKRIRLAVIFLKSFLLRIKVRDEQRIAKVSQGRVSHARFAAHA